MPLNSINYELKRRYPTALRDAGFKNTWDYIKRAESEELVTVQDDGNGSVYIGLANHNPSSDEVCEKPFPIFFYLFLFVSGFESLTLTTFRRI